MMLGTSVKRYLKTFKVISVAPIYYDKERKTECKYLQKLRWKINVLITMTEVNITENGTYFTPAVQKHDDYITKASLSESHTHLPMSTPTNYVPFRGGICNS